MSDKSILDSLLTFGISQTEGRIYVFLLNKEPYTILEISRNLHLPRTSIYDNVLKLIEKGLVEKHVLYKTQKFSASPLSILENLIDKEKNRLDTLTKNFKFLETTLAASLLPSTITQVRYYHGAQGFMQMMWNSLEAENEIIGYSEFGRGDIVGNKFLEKWINSMVDKKIIDRVITNPQPEILNYLSQPLQTSIRAGFQKTRYMDNKSLYISGDTTIYNNIFSVCYWKQGEVVGVEIENAELVKTQKSIFEQMWRLATPLEKLEAIKLK